MSRPFRRLARVGVLLAAAACASPPAGRLAAVHEERIARIESALLPGARVQGREYTPATLEARMDQLGVPAVSVAVIHDGRIAWARAWGVVDATTGAPGTTGTLFQAASMSKPVAAMGALVLVQEGRLSLDEDVNAWLRSWRVPSHRWEDEHPVTLRRLLTHTAGTTVHGFPGYPAGADLPIVTQVLAGQPPANTDPVVVSTRPGSTYRYSGGGTTVVQLVVEEVSGMPFARFMEERVLEPIGMTASTYRQPIPPERAARAATGHRAGARPIVGRFHTYPEKAAAGLWTTPTDLARWVLDVQRSLAGDTTSVLQPRLARAMVTAEPGTHGLGPGVNGAGDALRFAHGGSNAGFRGVFVGFVNRGEGAVIMTNADAGATIGNELLLAIAAEYGWPDFAPEVIVPAPVAPERLREYEGRYGSADQPLQVVVEVEGGSLILTTPDGVRREFVPVAPDRFRATAGNTTATFETDEAGSVLTLNVAGLRLPRQ